MDRQLTYACNACLKQAQKDPPSRRHSADTISILSPGVSNSGWLQTEDSYFIPQNSKCTFYICPKCQKRILLTDVNLPPGIEVIFRENLERYKRDLELSGGKI